MHWRFLAIFMSRMHWRKSVNDALSARNYPSALVCDVPPDRGTITLSEDRFWWLAVIERPGQLKHDDRFLRLEEAVVWVEQQIPELRAQD